VSGGCAKCKSRPRPGTDYRRTACATCTLAQGIDNPSNKGRTHVSLDADVPEHGEGLFFDGEGFVEAAMAEAELDIAADATGAGGDGEGLPPWFDALAAFFHAWLRLRPSDRDSVARMLAAPPGTFMAGVAKDAGCTSTGLKQRLARAAMLVPALAAAMPRLNSRRRGAA
jgi:hypothetical protein